MGRQGAMGIDGSAPPSTSENTSSCYFTHLSHSQPLCGAVRSLIKSVLLIQQECQELPMEEFSSPEYLCPSLLPNPAGPGTWDRLGTRTCTELVSCSVPTHAPYKTIRNSTIDLQFRLVQQKIRFCSRLFPEAVLSGPGHGQSSAADSMDGLRSSGAVPRHCSAVWELVRGLIG